MKRSKVQCHWLQTWVLGKAILSPSLTDNLELVGSMAVERALAGDSASRAARSGLERRVVAACSSAFHVADLMAEAFVVPDSPWKWEYIHELSLPIPIRCQL